MRAIDFFPSIFGVVPVPEIKQPAVRFQKGTVIVCPHCYKTIAYATRDILAGEGCADSAWESEYKLGETHMVCPEDGVPFARGGQLFTIGGWV